VGGRGLMRLLDEVLGNDLFCLVNFDDLLDGSGKRAIVDAGS